MSTLRGILICGWRVVAGCPRAARAGSRDAAGLRRVGRMLAPNTSPWSTPTRCRSCRRGRIRWVETSSPETCARSRRRQMFCHGNSPCQVLAMCRPSGANSSPQANSAPSRPPRAANSHSASVGSSLPAHARTPPRRDRRRARRDDRRDRRSSSRAVRMTPVRAEGSPTSVAIPQVDRSAAARTRASPLQHLGQRARVVLRLAARSRRRSRSRSPRRSARNRALVTGVRSIQKRSTETRWAGASSG